MLRRLSLPLSARVMAAAVGTATTTTTMAALTAMARWDSSASTATAVASGGSNASSSPSNSTTGGSGAGGSNAARGRSGMSSRPPRRTGSRAPMLPAFDIVHWNDADVSAGHLLRVLHRDSFIVFDYHRQLHPTTERGAGPTTGRAERVVTVTLPPVYIARFLGVLEGRMDKVEVQSRFTNALFVPNTTKGPHHYTLQCHSVRPTTGQQQTADGVDINEESVDWTVEFDPAEALMLHRFLTQALKYNTGFARRIQ